MASQKDKTDFEKIREYAHKAFGAEVDISLIIDLSGPNQAPYTLKVTKTLFDGGVPSGRGDFFLNASTLPGLWADLRENADEYKDRI
jgi:hypothetical protein